MELKALKNEESLILHSTGKDGDVVETDQTKYKGQTTKQYQFW